MLVKLLLILLLFPSISFATTWKDVNDYVNTAKSLYPTCKIWVEHVFNEQGEFFKVWKRCNDSVKVQDTIYSKRVLEHDGSTGLPYTSLSCNGSGGYANGNTSEGTPLWTGTGLSTVKKLTCEGNYLITETQYAPTTHQRVETCLHMHTDYTGTDCLASDTLLTTYAGPLVTDCNPEPWGPSGGTVSILGSCEEPNLCLPNCATVGSCENMTGGGFYFTLTDICGDPVPNTQDGGGPDGDTNPDAGTQIGAGSPPPTDAGTQGPDGAMQGGTHTSITTSTTTIFTNTSTTSTTYTVTNPDGSTTVSGTGSTTTAVSNSQDESINIPGIPAVDASKFNTDWPMAELTANDWGPLVESWIASNPLVAVAQGTHLDITGSNCVVGPVTIWGKSISIDFCTMAVYLEMLGAFIVGVAALYSTLIALGGIK